MPKKPTLKDVAREAGVSVATVSYILNNRADQKISEATRKKVLQIANLLDYTPNSTAKSLATGRSNLIGIATHQPTEAPSRSQEIHYFIRLLTERLNRMNYDVLLIPVHKDTKASPFHHNVDAVIAIDLNQEEFARMADEYYVPVISVDMLVNDSLFYQIYSDLPALIRQVKETVREDFYLITDEYSNQNYYEFITGEVPASRALLFSRCTREELNALRGKKVLALGACLACLLRPYVNDRDLTVICSDDSCRQLLRQNGIAVVKCDVAKKANVTVNILLNALDKKFDVSHDCRI